MGLCFWAAGAFAQSSDGLAALQARAEAGESAAQFALGTRYLNGEGVAADNFEALRWFTLAADQDNANAQYNIAVMYLNGLGVIRDEAEALEWFLKAANNGDRQSQFTLGVVMFNGRMGAPQNTAEAYRWFTLAGAGGHQSAAANAVLIQELLPPAEVERVQREVQQWIEEFNSQQAGSPPS
ncbi:tetratricopeptide repeat protein [Pseudohongiella sp. O18]|uniref:tetratricopeptide repeat protein n=1 Tax=Pseudohongiella sp. O18 TaxID=2904248 RepID=UPI001F1EFEEF|nr:tetratricopeptide repeat protein [Pseudohongiella sp. O18]